ncbi:MAG: nitrile hydratase subunit alpha [bacterium]
MTDMMEDLVFDLYSNPELKQRFMGDPAGVMKERGVVVPDDVSLRVVEDTETVRHIVLPYPDPGEVAKVEEIEQRVSKITV